MMLFKILVGCGIVFSVSALLLAFFSWIEHLQMCRRSRFYAAFNFFDYSVFVVYAVLTCSLGGLLVLL